MAQAVQRGEYPDDWSALADRVKADAGGRCVRCGKAHNAYTGYTLTVHHFDGNRSNNARFNLMALCQRCHLSIQARVDPAVPIMFDPSKWSLPYIAGLYEAGGCDPGPLYSLRRWIDEYFAALGTWPHWAPTESRFERAEG